MKLLFDQNLSHRLVQAVKDFLPNSTHVRNVDLKEESDEKIWDFAKDNGYTIISKDEDFHQRSFLFGYPPKVIWLKLGNCTTSEVELF